MFIRPQFWGNVSAKLSEDVQQNRNLMIYEAFILGVLHSKGADDIEAYLKSLHDVSFQVWQADVEAMAEFINQQFKNLKPGT